MKNIDSYDWDNLYEKAEKFIRKYIPDADVNRGTKSFSDGKPRVEVRFKQKGNLDTIKNLNKKMCFRSLRGTNINGSRMCKAEIIFSEDGTLN